MKNNKLILAGSDLGVHIDGASLGPKKVFENIEYENKILLEQNKEYKKELSKEIKNKNEKELVSYLAKLSSLYNNTLKNNEFPIMIGGDHSLAISSALNSNFHQGPLGIIWFDAHADYHIHQTTVTGNLHGLPLATINGKDSNWFKFDNYKYISEENTVIFGARSIDPGEYDNLNKANVTIITQDEIKSLGIEQSLTKAYKIASNNTSGIHISFDLDYLDPSIASGVSTPVNDGGSIKDYSIIKQSFINNINIIKSFDIVEYNSLNDKNNETLNIVLDLLNNVFNIK